MDKPFSDMLPLELRVQHICAVLVTYHPGADLSGRLASIRPQVGSIVVIDNGSGTATQEALRRMASIHDIELILNADNLGIGAALNQGAAWAMQNGFFWILTLDQDSIPENDMVSGLWEVHEQLGEKSRIGIIAANFSSQHGKRWKEIAGLKSAWIMPEAVITSGSLLSLQAYREIGPFREDFFIDMVDTEYSLRLRKGGFLLYMTTRPLMNHAIGSQTSHRLFGMNIIALNHSVARRYYIARNRLILARHYAGFYPRIVWRELRNMVVESIVILLYEHDKLMKLSALMLGIADAARGRMGPRTNLHTSVK